MLPLLIYIFLKKYRHPRQLHSWLLKKFWNSFLVAFMFSLLLLFLLFIPQRSTSQSILLNYKVVKGGDTIGWMQLERKLYGNIASLSLVSEIKTRVLLLISVSAKESSTFVNGKLTYTSLFRETNGSIKLDKTVKFTNEKYEVDENSKKKTLAVPLISTNLISLYFNEPAGVTAVYSEKHECFIPVSKTNNGGYKVSFPDGNSNCYYYSGGYCSKVEINHTFYSAQAILKQ